MRGRHPPASHPHPSTLHPCVALFVFLTHQRDLEALPGNLSFHPSPAQSPKTLGSPPQNPVFSDPIWAHSNPWTRCVPHRVPAPALPGPADVHGAPGSQSRSTESQLLGRAREAQGAQSPPWALLPSPAAHQSSYQMIPGGHWVRGGSTLDSTLHKQGWMSGPQRGEAPGIYSPAAKLTAQNIDDTISNKA